MPETEQEQQTEQSEATENVQTEQDEKVETTEKVEETVPKARFEEVMAAKNAAEERIDLLNQQQQVIMANQQKTEQKPPFDPYSAVGATDDDEVLTVGQQKRIDKHRMTEIMAALSEVQFMASHPKFEEIVGTPEQIRAMQFAPPLAKAIKQNPALMQTITFSPNRREIAYQVAKLMVENKTEAKPQPKPEAEAGAVIDEAIQNANTVKSSSNVAGGSGVLSEEGRLLNMSDEAFEDMARKNGADI